MSKNIISREIVFIELQKFCSDFISMEKDFQAIIFDRVYFSLADWSNLFVNFDCFFILDSLENMKIYGDVKPDFMMRLFMWPLNYQLLLDDLKSITKIKEYMQFGEIDLGGVSLSLNMRVLKNNFTEVYLKNREFELLCYLAKNKGRVLSRMNILENVWDMNSNIMTNTVDVHISKIRKILTQHFGLSNLIRTIPCSGYVLA